MGIDYISGFEGKHIKKFIEVMEKIWKKEGEKKRGAKDRYQLLLCRSSGRGIFTLTVSTEGETILLWNLTQENIKDLEAEAKERGIPIGFRPYLWFGKAPVVLPNEIVEETGEKEEKEQPEDKT